MADNEDLLMKLGKCAATCENCMDACLDEPDIKKMVPCIRLDRDCAKICHVAASFVASNSEFSGSVITLCEELCKRCGEECEKHDTKHCKQCAEACRECAEACSAFNN